MIMLGVILEVHLSVTQIIENECDITTEFSHALCEWLPDTRSHKACGNGIL